MTTKSNRSAGTQITKRGITQGTSLVDPVGGNPVDVITDGDGVRRLAVDTVLDASGATFDVELDPTTDGVYVGDKDSGNKLKINADGSIDANTSINAADGDTIAISGHNSQIFDEFADTITTLAYEEIFSYTSASDDTRLVALEATAQTPATFVLKIDGVIKRTLKSSPLERNVVFTFREPRQLQSGKKVTVEALVDRLILPSYDTFVSLEGYLTT